VIERVSECSARLRPALATQGNARKKRDGPASPQVSYPLIPPRTACLRVPLVVADESVFRKLGVSAAAKHKHTHHFHGTSNYTSNSIHYT
jgi:hypothetical protein